MIAKRLLDIALAVIGLCLVCPLLILIAVSIKLDSVGPVLFRQQRVGRNGRLFRIRKFRTMVLDAPRLGAEITIDQDPRITRVGRLLRQFKLDELPQLVDVLLGDMSIVGPRPEVPKYVQCYPETVRKEILSVRPGITDPASIEFFDESTMLKGSQDPERTYIEEILPIKLRYYVQYVRERSMLLDLLVIVKTLTRIVK